MSAYSACSSVLTAVRGRPWGGRASDRRRGRGGRDTIVNVWQHDQARWPRSARWCVGRSRRARPRRLPGATVLARVRRQRQGRCRRCQLMITPLDCPAGRSRSRSPISTTGRTRRPCSAAQAPWWKPGTASGYHAITQGCLSAKCREAACDRRVLRQSTPPLDADFFIGTPAEADDRWRTSSRPRRSRRRPSRPGETSRTRQLDAAASSTIDVAAVRDPAPSVGHGNSRSVATAQSVVQPSAATSTVSGCRRRRRRRASSTSSRTVRPRPATSCSSSASATAITSPSCRSDPIRARTRGGWGGSPW